MTDLNIQTALLAMANYPELSVEITAAIKRELGGEEYSRLRLIAGHILRMREDLDKRMEDYDAD